MHKASGSDPAIADDSPYYFDARKANRAERFFEINLVLWEGSAAGQAFDPLPWMRRIVRDIFGVLRKEDGMRRYRFCFIVAPRKTAKTTFAAGVLLYMLTADGEPGAEVIAAAVTREQAGKVFDCGKAFVDGSRARRWKEKVEEWQYEIRHPSTRSVAKIITAETKATHGRNIHLLLIDELHEFIGEQARNVYEALTTSMGSRSQPLVFIITTPAHDGQESIYHEIMAKAEAVRDGTSRDEQFYSAIFRAEDADDWKSEEVWAKANPSLGITVKIDVYRQQCLLAQESKSAENTFRRLFLCQRTQQQTRWLDLAQYDAAATPIEDSTFHQKPILLGLDLSSVYDLTALARLDCTSPIWRLKVEMFIPEEHVADRSKRDSVPYDQWIADGHLTAMPGEAIDQGFLFDRILAVARESQVRRLAADPSNFVALQVQLERAGIECVQVRQDFRSMSNAALDFERRIRTRQIIIDDNPVLRFCASNVEIIRRNTEIRLTKPRARGQYAGRAAQKNDGIVAAVIACTQALLLSEEMSQKQNYVSPFVLA